MFPELRRERATALLDLDTDGYPGRSRVNPRPQAHVAGPGLAPELPILHLGAMGAFHRRDIYDDVC